tara:strand:+ start:2763 stop:3059 length:297 start_codon:yes stop_codon:yes gene_type:complete
MSHELQFPELVVEPEYDWDDTISITSSNYFYVPSIPEWAYSEYDGLLYEGVQYDWDEVSYRLSVDVPTIPEPADAGLVGAVLVGIFVAFCYFKNKKGK